MTNGPATTVLVHGVGLDRQMWTPFATILADHGVSTHTYDMIGLGDGPRPPGPYSLTQYGRQLAQEISRVSHDDGHGVDIVGFSMGALVALRCTIDHPELVRRLVIVSGVFDRTDAERAAILARVVDARSGRYRESIEPALSRWFTPEFTAAQPAVVDAVRGRMLANDERSYADAYEVFATGDAELTAIVHTITAPTLVITGAQDERSTPGMAQALAKAVTGARSSLLPNVKHLVPLEAPGRLADVVIPFLLAGT